MVDPRDVLRGAAPSPRGDLDLDAVRDRVRRRRRQRLAARFGSVLLVVALGAGVAASEFGGESSTAADDIDDESMALLCERFRTVRVAVFSRPPESLSPDQGEDYLQRELSMMHETADGYEAFAQEARQAGAKQFAGWLRDGANAIRELADDFRQSPTRTPPSPRVFTLEATAMAVQLNAQSTCVEWDEGSGMAGSGAGLGSALDGVTDETVRDVCARFHAIRPVGGDALIEVNAWEELARHARELGATDFAATLTSAAEALRASERAIRRPDYATGGPSGQEYSRHNLRRYAAGANLILACATRGQFPPSVTG